MRLTQGMTIAIVTVATLAFSVSPAMASTLLPAGGTWEYTFTDPTAALNWNTTTGVGGIWSSGLAPFGNNTGGYSPDDPSGFFDWATYWPTTESGIPSQLWLRQAVNLTTVNLASVLWNLGVDNGYTLYANGNVVSSGYAEGYTSRWEYNGDFGANLIQGSNVIALAVIDRGVLTAFDMQITGERNALAGDPVPEPSTLLLLGSGLAGLGALKRIRGRLARRPTVQ